MLRVCSNGMPERLDLSSQQKVERLDLIAEAFSFVKVGEGAYDSRAANRDPSHGRRGRKWQSFSFLADRSSRYVYPSLADPLPVIALKIGRV